MNVKRDAQLQLALDMLEHIDIPVSAIHSADRLNILNAANSITNYLTDEQIVDLAYRWGERGIDARL